MQIVDFCCLSPHGESGLKSLTSVVTIWPAGLSPHGESGLKSSVWGDSPDSEMSLPAWGEWIEIVYQDRKRKRKSRLSPHGESGLKYHGLAAAGHDHQSLPAWGEWIEIIAQAICRTRATSLPAWGEWIEIQQATSGSHSPTSLSPHGESGLKCVYAV